MKFTLPLLALLAGFAAAKIDGSSVNDIDNNELGEEPEPVAQDLLYGLNPVLDIAKIKDNMTNRDVGYLFVKHEENGF
ncbi:uncharacterized protein G6M90_00g066020 [Metarhizium brunneum]|uniref:Uncharacterized protein n=1 Tax=Metarhizium brunneum TaxID=500148 RepID=A0A7D5YU43_9HYPO|nr:hypothetical protein G6M90_00g066020 [Metarhizium brunneum]